MKIILSLIFVVCFVIGEEYLNPNALNPGLVGAVEVPLADRNTHHFVQKRDKNPENNGNNYGWEKPKNPHHTVPCIENNGHCKLNASCCLGYCKNNKNCTCANIDEACTDTRECCKGICKNGKCGTCVYTNEGTCSDSTACCRGSCNPGEACACGANGNDCEIDNNCCGGTCGVDKKCNCIPYVYGDGAPGYCETAPVDPCCYGTCRKNSTGGYQCLGALLYGTCNMNYDCATNLFCIENRCSCRGDGESCADNPLLCCQGLNCYSATNLCKLTCQDSTTVHLNPIFV